MSHDAINSWVEKAKSEEDNTDAAPRQVQVVRRPEARGKGNVIMEVAEKLRPWIMKMLEGARDRSGMLVQPATVRAIALNVAQDILNTYHQ
jgi:hypothetical protein